MKQDQQLSMDFLTSELEPIDELVNYEPLDWQLAELMQQLNGEENQTLKNCTLEISKHTREGQIALACNQAQQDELSTLNVVGKAGDYQPLILDNGYCYLRRYWQYQQQLADQINSRLSSQEVTTEQRDWQEERFQHYFNDDSIKDETNWQKVAAERALNHDFLILSGGPGTGKTTTITRILALLIEQSLMKEGVSILLAAPTGKAAIRMLDAIRETQQRMNLSEDVQKRMPKRASTIHKLLGFQRNSVNFKHNQKRPLNADIVLIDEASMIDIALMSKLLNAIPRDAKLILIGDKDQLSSVETGSVFADICKGLEGRQNLVTLQKNWRFEDNSGIAQLATAANNGDSPKVLEVLRDKKIPECTLIFPIVIATKRLPSDFVLPWKNYLNILNDPTAKITEIFKAFNQYRVLCALRRGLQGSQVVNQRIETVLAKQGSIHLGKSQNKIWYHGRPVMVTQNSYSKGLFNGDTGITLIRNGETKVYFPDSLDDNENAFKSIAPIRLPVHETTWAMTIHKSQGSEFDQVILVLPNEPMPLLTRQLIYTGITRAKKSINIVASEDILKTGIKNEVLQATQIEQKLLL